jgi:YVTN family beta-propeller protein
VIPSAFSLALALSVLALPALGEDRDASELTLEATIPRTAGAVASTDFAFGALWVSQGGPRLLRIDGRDNSVTEAELPGGTGRLREIAAGEGAVWVPDVGLGAVHKVDPELMAVVAQFPADMLSTQATIGVGEGAVWVVTAQDLERALTRFDANTGAEEALIELPAAGAGVLVAYGQVWVSSSQANTVFRIDPAANAVVESITVGQSPKYMAAGAGSIWVLGAGDGDVQRIDAITGAVDAIIDLGFPSITGDIAFGGGYVWISVPYRAPVIRIDPSDNGVTRYLGRGSQGYIQYGNNSIWVWGQAINRYALP